MYQALDKWTVAISRYHEVSTSIHAAQDHAIIQGAITVSSMQILHIHSRKDSLAFITQSSLHFTGSMRT